MDDNGLAHLTDDNFEDYLTVHGGVHFIKFYAPWYVCAQTNSVTSPCHAIVFGRCGHCQRLAPTWDELAAHFEKQSNVHISKVDCTLHSSTCQRQGVKGYPTLLLFVDGEMQSKYSGQRGQ